MELLLNPAKAKWPPGCNRRWREGKEDQPKSINFIFLFYLILFYFIIFQEHSFKKKKPTLPFFQPTGNAFSEGWARCSMGEDLTPPGFGRV